LNSGSSGPTNSHCASVSNTNRFLLIRREFPRLCRGGSRSLTVTGTCSPSICLRCGREDGIARFLLLFLLLLSPVAVRPLRGASNRKASGSAGGYLLQQVQQTIHVMQESRA
jgi:hypothetical protein